VLLTRIVGPCAKRGITIYRLERDLGLGNGTIRNWGVAIPGSGKLKAVADYFDVTVDDLLQEDSQ